MTCSGLLNGVRLKLNRVLFRRSKLIPTLVGCLLLMVVVVVVVMRDGNVDGTYYDEDETFLETDWPSSRMELERSVYDRPLNETDTNDEYTKKIGNHADTVLSRKMKSSKQNEEKANATRGRNQLVAEPERRNHTRADIRNSRASPRWRSYKEALEACAENGTRRLIILSLVDEGFIEMALNFYDVSLKPYRLDMLLFIGLTYRTCRTLERQGLPCYMYREMESGRQASLFHSTVFLQKMNIRTDMVLEALLLGYTVLHTDLDLTYFADPLEHIPCRGVCDLAALIDQDDYNAGFIFLRPTNNSIWIYRRMGELAAASPLLDDQDQLTQAIEELENNCINFVVIRLDRGQFQNGLQYFELADRTFDGDDEIAPCTRCVVVHNNWIVSVEAKIYRFKELHQWFYDGPQSYYTAVDRKYLLYSNPLRLEDPDEMERLERSALISALAICQLLNRTLVLPKFHCYDKDGRGKRCALNSKFNVASFDAEFSGHYREHSFLDHPLVPERFKSRSGPVFLILTNVTETYMARVIRKGAIVVMRPKRPGGATPSEILHWYIMIDSPVLRFHSLYGAFSVFDRPSVRYEFQNKVNNGLKASTYRQLD
ncbi:hypothetical protein LSH36_297g02016 [Paralvinella palmiformis]|uniref:Nucleotide-diphospho-sugar transferase domain-containing protein n=1 Tax=Paralvinella palmiformis TaxID=53620 RepID=A0AAD9JI62_9ANNE|nr:hypothetical protein LSH36_297g02016 [Paralvinella palmiformis]